MGTKKLCYISGQEKTFSFIYMTKITLKTLSYPKHYFFIKQIEKSVVVFLAMSFAIFKMAYY